MSNTTAPTSESLTLSATLFHADVDSWLPANFGVSQPESAKAAEWEQALRSSADRAQRLGLGHAALEDANLGAKFRNQRAGIDVLEKKLKRRKDDGEEKVSGAGKEEDSEEEAESRTRSIKTNKRKNDPFAGKPKVHPALAKKEEKVHPALLKGKTEKAEEKVHPAILKMRAEKEKEKGEKETDEKETDEDSTPPSSRKRPRDDSDDEDEKKDEEKDDKKDDGPVLSKAERKREKKRRQKLRKAADRRSALRTLIPCLCHPYLISAPLFFGLYLPSWSPPPLHSSISISHLRIAYSLRRSRVARINHPSVS